MMGFLLFQPAPARIAMIGLGGGSLAKYCALKLPEADFTAIERRPHRQDPGCVRRKGRCGRKAEHSANTVVFAGTDASFPPTFSQFVARLRAFQASHPVCLDVTLRRILRHGEPRQSFPRRRRQGRL